MSEEKKEEVLEQEKKLDENELNAVAGGDACGCGFGGYGSEDGSGNSCECILGGAGTGHHSSEVRCVCPLVGGGKA